MNLLEISEEEITINDSQGNEIVKWVESEWIEDSAIVVSIANAINIVYIDGEEALKDLLKV